MALPNAPGPAPEAAPALPSRWLLALLALALVRGVLYTFIVPPWQHPDEPTHFEHVRAIAETGRVVEEEFVSLPMRREITGSMLRHGFWRGIEQPPLDDASLSAVGSTPLGIYTFTQPRLYYIVGALWLWPWLGLPVDLQLYALRLFSVLLNLVIVACVFRIARLLFPNQLALAVGAAGFIAFQPMHTDIMAAVNNDALINALAAIYFLIVAQAYHGRRAWWTIPVGALTLAAGIVTKSTGLVLAFTSPLALLGYPWKRRWLWLGIAAALALAGLALVLAGSLLGGQTSPALQPWLDAFGRYARIGVDDTLQALVDPERSRIYRSSAGIVFRSFWAAFGWRHVVLTPGWYWLPGLAMIAALIGLGAQALRPRPDSNRGRAAAYLLFGAGAVIFAWAAAILRSQVMQGIGLYLSHGRYAFFAMTPFALLMAAGLLGWLPAARRPRAALIFLGAWAVFDALAFWGYLVPYYYSTP